MSKLISTTTFALSAICASVVAPAARADETEAAATSSAAASETAPASDAAQPAAAAAAEPELDVSAFLAEANPTVENDSPTLRFYGFTDFTILKSFTNNPQFTISFPTSPQFFVGNFNLYLDADLTHGFRSLSEVRFLFIPGGTDVPNAAGFLDPTVNSRYSGSTDYSDFGRIVDWGAIEIQRIYVEYTAHSLLRVRAGRFLTPFGIWNVDHGSPVLIGVSAPYMIGLGLLPKAQTGFEVFGSYGFGDTTLGYHLTLSNGRGPIEKFGDFDNNKAIGGRIYANLREFGDLTVGASGYLGRYSDQRSQLDLTLPAPAPVAVMVESYRESAIAADLKFEYGPIALFSEVAMQDRVWDDGLRGLDIGGVDVADNRRWGMYVVAAYRLPWLNIRPYLSYEHFGLGRIADPYFLGASHTNGYGGGVNIRLVPSVVLKGSFIYVFFEGAPAGSVAADGLAFLTTQLSWAF